MRSGQPSPFTSEKTAADIKPTLWNRLELSTSSTKRPPSFRNIREDCGLG